MLHDGLALISSELPEMVALADRILVMHEFRLVDSFDNDRSYEAMSRKVMGVIHRHSDEAVAAE